MTVCAYVSDHVDVDVVCTHSIDLSQHVDMLDIPSARRKVLKARNDSPLIQDPVPLDEHAISELHYEMVHIDEKGQDIRDEIIDIDQVSLQAHWREKAKILNLRTDVHDVGEVVREGVLPDFQMNLDLLNSLFAPRRLVNTYTHKYTYIHIQHIYIYICMGTVAC